MTWPATSCASTADVPTGPAPLPCRGPEEEIPHPDPDHPGSDAVVPAGWRIPDDGVQTADAERGPGWTGPPSADTPEGIAYWYRCGGVAQPWLIRQNPLDDTGSMAV